MLKTAANDELTLIKPSFEQTHSPLIGLLPFGHTVIAESSAAAWLIGIIKPKRAVSTITRIVERSMVIKSTSQVFR